MHLFPIFFRRRIVIEIDWRSGDANVGTVPSFDVWLEIFS